GLDTACFDFRRYSANRSDEDNFRIKRIVSELRELLAEVCIEALKPDLIILDEFQRFREILYDDNDAAILARKLMNYKDARVLLLSATPYKMLTLYHEDEENHYADFMKALGFLIEDKEKENQIEQDLEQIRIALYDWQNTDSDALIKIQQSLRKKLLSVMVRTERVGITKQQNSMLVESQIIAMPQPIDLLHACNLDKIARNVEARNTIEYWKSAPYLLNFMKKYQLKKLFDDSCKSLNDEMIYDLDPKRCCLLKGKKLQRYDVVEPTNARLRKLTSETINTGDWKLLWMPPSLPYYRSEKFYANLKSPSKSLIFSSWNVVPDTIAALMSYEVERKMVTRSKEIPTYKELNIKKKPLLIFKRDGNELTGMNILALIYPCPTLVDEIDPLKISLENIKQGFIRKRDMIHMVKKEIHRLVEKISPGNLYKGGAGDKQWYWAGLALLDKLHKFHPEEWCIYKNEWHQLSYELDGYGEKEQKSALNDHLQLFNSVFKGKIELSKPPRDLDIVFTELALGSPAICAARALKRVAPNLQSDSTVLMNAAAKIAMGFRSLFNNPEYICLLRRRNSSIPYWRSVLQYAIEGNLQSVLDEYVHILLESNGLKNHPEEKIVSEIADTMYEVIALHVSSVQIDDIRLRPKNRKIEMNQFKIRCRYALRFGDVRDDREQILVRKSSVQKAFNSPFWPFILASTSIGQEGLDFHSYCHKVWHWNLPSNPVDLEQREGRVQRYKGHAIRKNIARKFGLEILEKQWDRKSDPWDVLFDKGKEVRSSNLNDLYPYWVFDDVENPDRVERRVPMIPFSKEHSRLARLKNSLALYRLVFGQPCQEDLLNYLVRTTPENNENTLKWQLKLDPP
ncbi:MAG: hypothetical protein A2161_20360, partial [Candidatus Schekmanbacteria bacterium RBG_13_48_7]